MINFYCATCPNLELSLTIVMDDGNQYFEKQSMSKTLHNALEKKGQYVTNAFISTCNYLVSVTKFLHISTIVTSC